MKDIYANRYSDQATEKDDLVDEDQIRAISPFKVTDFGTNRKLIYDILSIR